MQTLARSMIALLGPALAVAAQVPDAPRRVHPGRVLDAKGEPVAGAEVVFVTTDGIGAVEPGDVVRVESSDSGRFRARLLPTRTYRAWAVASDDQVVEGKVVTSPFVEMQLPMTELRFEATPNEALTKLHINGLDAWREHGEVRVEVSLQGVDGLVEAQVVGESDEVELPRLPASGLRAPLQVTFFVDGRMVHAGDVWSGGRINVPKPQVVRARVADSAGAPVAGARIERVWSTWSRHDGPFPVGPLSRRFPLGETDAAGELEWLVANGKDPFKSKGGWPAMAFVAGKAGYLSGISGFSEAVFRNDALVEGDIEDRTLPFVLTDRAPIRATVRGAAPGQRLFVGGSHSLICSQNSYTTAGDLAVGDALVDGVATLLPWPETLHDVSLQLTGVAPELDDADPFARVVTPRPLELVGKAYESDFTLDLADVVPLRVQVLDATGGPAMGAYIACITLDDDRGNPVARPARADAAGRIVLPVLPGKWFLVAVHQDLWARAPLDVVAGQPVTTLSLEPMPRARLRVLDGDGKPVAGAKVSSGGASWGGTGDPVDNIMQELGHVLAGWSMRQCVSGDDGTVDVPFLPARGLQVDCRVSKGKRKSDEFDLRAHEERVDVVIR